MLPWLVAFLVLGVAAGGVWWARLRPWPFGRPVTTAPAPNPHPILAPSTDLPKPGSDLPKIVQPEDGQKPDSARKGDACLERGTQALSKLDFAAAVPDLEQAAKLMPKDAKVFSRLGAAWSGQNRWDRAVESYTKAIEIEHHPLDYMARGQAYRKLDRIDDAIADFQQSAELDPKNAKAYAELCDIYLDKEEPLRAIDEISKAIEICQGDAKANFREFTALHLRAYAYLNLGKIDNAAADLERVSVLAESDQDRARSYELFYSLALKFAEARRFPDAARWIKKAIAFAPDEATRSSLPGTAENVLVRPRPVASPKPVGSHRWIVEDEPARPRREMGANDGFQAVRPRDEPVQKSGFSPGRCRTCFCWRECRWTPGRGATLCLFWPSS